jgi:hypothetical protein
MITGAEVELTVYQFAVATGKYGNEVLITRNFEANQVDETREQSCRTAPR